MSKTIGIESGNYAFYDNQAPPVDFLRKVIAQEKDGLVVAASGCDLVVADTIVTNGINIIKAIKCRTENCPSNICVFNKK